MRTAQFEGIIAAAGLGSCDYHHLNSWKYKFFLPCRTKYTHDYACGLTYSRIMPQQPRSPP